MKKSFVVLFMISNILSFGKEEVVVLAASSLTKVMTIIEDEYTGDIINSFAGSQSLKFQIEQGVEADLFISANKKYVDNLYDEGLLEGVEEFTTNELVIISSKRSGIKTFDDFLEKKYFLGVANKSVPIGSYGDMFLDKLENDYRGIKEKIYGMAVSESLNVSDLVIKVEIDAIDLAIVYRTDVDDEKVNLIEIPEKYKIETKYYLGRIKESKNKIETERLVEYMKSLEGKEIIEGNGFKM